MTERYRITIEVSKETHDFYQKVPWGLRSSVLAHVLLEVQHFLTSDMRTGIQLLLSGKVGLASRTDLNPDPAATLARSSGAHEAHSPESSDKQETRARRSKANPPRTYRRRKIKAQDLEEDFKIDGR